MDDDPAGELWAPRAGDAGARDQLRLRRADRADHHRRAGVRTRRSEKGPFAWLFAGFFIAALWSCCSGILVLALSCRFGTASPDEPTGGRVPPVAASPPEFDNDQRRSHRCRLCVRRRRPTLPGEGRYWVAPSAAVIGKVTLEEDVSIWFGAVLRGDNEPIRRRRAHQHPGTCVIHTDPGFPARSARIARSAIAPSCMAARSARTPRSAWGRSC